MKINKKVLNKIFIGYSFLGPPILGFFVFTLFPVVASFVLAFMEWDIITPAKFVGFDNFIKMINDQDFLFWLFQ